MKKVLTVDIHATSPSGPLANFITEQLFVSGVGTGNIEPI
jgi:sorbitol-specific phosphotransferase system component IIBC